MKALELILPFMVARVLIGRDKRSVGLLDSFKVGVSGKEYSPVLVP